MASLDIKDIFKLANDVDSLLVFWTTGPNCEKQPSYFLHCAIQCVHGSNQILWDLRCYSCQCYEIAARMTSGILMTHFVYECHDSSSKVFSKNPLLNILADVILNFFLMAYVVFTLTKIHKYFYLSACFFFSSFKVCSLIFLSLKHFL